MLRLLAPILLLILSLPALAQDTFDGTWNFVVTGETDPLMIIEFDTSGVTLQGAGVIPQGDGVLQPGSASVVRGAAIDGMLQVELTLAPQGETALFTVVDNQGATLEIAGTFFRGELVQFGSSTTASAAPVEETAAEDACASMQAIQQEVFLHADNAQRQVLRRIYDDADARFGQENSTPRCSHLLAELSRLHDTATVTTAPGFVPQTAYGSACDEVAPLVEAIFADLQAAGVTGTGEVQRILEESGLGDGGAWSTGACEYGIANLRDYQVQIGAVPAAPVLEDSGTATTETIKDPTLPAPQIDPNGLRSLRFEVRDVSEHLNMRAGPGTDYGVTYQLPYFARDLTIVGQGCSPGLNETGFAYLPITAQLAQLESRWCEVEWNGTRGWVAARYLRPM